MPKRKARKSLSAASTQSSAPPLPPESATPATTENFATPVPTTEASKTSPLQWNEAMELALLEGLVDEVRRGKRADSGFKKESWVAVLPRIQACVTQADEQGRLRLVDQNKAAAKRSDLKALWIEWLALKDASGAGFDESTGLLRNVSRGIRKRSRHRWGCPC